ncbi:MAG: DUF58 domain-containing protein, partial [Desulfurococcales archaeon]|nr:DUF58 domain-containing protein [Desulfurococcales archaeon]
PGILGLGLFMTGSIIASIAYSMIAASSYRVRVERRASIGREASKGSITIRVENESPLPLFWVSIREEAPPGVVAYARPEFFSMALPGRSSIEASYKAAARMGTHCFKAPRIRFRDPLGVSEAELPFEYRGPRCVRVKPRAASREELARYLSGRRIGEGAVRDKGFGIELYQLRDYREGDPAKLIDWKATARIGRLIVRETLTEQRGEAAIVLMADSRGSRGPMFSTPVEEAARVALGLAIALKSMGYNVRFHLVTPGYEYRVSGFEDTESKVGDALSQIRLPLEGELDRARIEGALKEYARGGEAIIITAGPPPEAVRGSIKRAAARLQVIDLAGGHA